ncbi:MAG: DUF3179 domain-containing protein [Halioglobus sp.]
MSAQIVMQRHPRKIAILVFIASMFMSAYAILSYSQDTDEAPFSIGHTNKMLSLIVSTNPTQIELTIARLDRTWKPQYIAPLLEVISYASSPITQRAAISLLEEKTGQVFGQDVNSWYRWLWNQAENVSDEYADFKADFYQFLDPRFGRYFRDRQSSAKIRLDEIRWGGVGQDGIPPLRSPEMIAASEASYLEDDNIIFGIEINGDTRAYPKRILAWHEMFVDTVGGVNIAGVYCTLCGTVIPYKTDVGDRHFELGTSGFLYRSNKLMYDRETQSLWNTIKGEPVLGPLAGQGITLEFLSVVTTTWGEWKQRHPDTTVLSLDTGHKRDYGEGVAYQQYFANDKLMFNTPFSDKRLKNKQEVLALRFAASPKEQLAIDTDFLNKNPLYEDNVGQQKLLVLTDRSGANRVYDPGSTKFHSYDGRSTLVDNTGQQWTLSESQLISAQGAILERLPYHRAFWFGWHANYPDTRLVK